ncbi:PEP-CTERM putative exosortase interaction domain-containing protein [Opitutaceae bacterium TAV1]|nr:PEP-CTERM putative exosortase interaction domain-containing protein [Opitutaceae bacterium TAV1]
MKTPKLLPILSIAIVLTWAAPATATAQTLYLHYDFNGATDSTKAVNTGSLGSDFDLTYYDASKNVVMQGSTAGVGGGTGNHAFNNNSGTWNGAGGVAKSTTGDFADVGSLASLTLTFWANPDGSWGNNSRIMESNQGLQLRSYSNGSLWVTLGGVRVESKDNYLVNGTTERTWTFYAITFDSSNVYFWRGTEDSAVTLFDTQSISLSAWTPTAVTSPLLGIGNTPGTSQDRAMKGLLDEVRFYGATSGTAGALGEAALNSIRTTGAIPEPGTVALLLAGFVGISAGALRRRSG